MSMMKSSVAHFALLHVCINVECQTCGWCVYQHSHRRGRAVCSREFVLCEPGLTAGSVGGSCRRRAPAQTTSCRPTWPTPTGLRREQAGGTDGECWKIPILIVREPGQVATLAVMVRRIGGQICEFEANEKMKCYTKAVAVPSRGAGDGCEAGGSVETGRFSATPLAGLLNDIDGVWLEGQTHIDLDYASRAGDRRDMIKRGFDF